MHASKLRIALGLTLFALLNPASVVRAQSCDVNGLRISSPLTLDRNRIVAGDTLLVTPGGPVVH